jgi:hypothetical protein
MEGSSLVSTTLTLLTTSLLNDHNFLRAFHPHLLSTSSHHPPGTFKNSSKRSHVNHVVSKVSADQCFRLSDWITYAGSLGG